MVEQTTKPDESRNLEHLFFKHDVVSISAYIASGSCLQWHKIGL